MVTTRDKIGIIIMSARKSEKLTQADLAKKTDLSRSYISALENGKAAGKFEDLRKIAQVLKIDTPQLFENKIVTESRQDVLSGSQYQHDQLDSGSPDEQLDFSANSFSSLEGQSKTTCSFVGFIQGSSNLLAYKAASDICRAQVTYPNPLYIFGDTGTGKSHILRAIYGEIISGKEKIVIYLRADSLKKEVRSSLEMAFQQVFRHDYIFSGVLLIDDIHFIAGKDEVQEQFLHAFDALDDAGIQMVISSNAHPRAIPGFREDLGDRFEGGLIVEMEHPDFDTRVQILQEKFKAYGYDCPLKTLKHIAEHYRKSVRQLVGCVHRIVHYAKLYEADLTTETAKLALKVD